MRISDWSSDVCSSDLVPEQRLHQRLLRAGDRTARARPADGDPALADGSPGRRLGRLPVRTFRTQHLDLGGQAPGRCRGDEQPRLGQPATRSEEHTSELQSLMRISYAVFCLKNKKTTNTIINN